MKIWWYLTGPITLKLLDLALDLSDPALDNEHASVDPHWDDFDSQPTKVDLGGINPSRNGHLRRLLINTLIDKQLASSIFKVISAATLRCAMRVLPSYGALVLRVDHRARYPLRN